MTGPPIREEPLELDADFRPADIIEALQLLKFTDPDELKPIRVDQQVRELFGRLAQCATCSAPRLNL